MQGLFKKLWHSATATTWLAQTVTPLRLLILTPLVLTRFSKTELDVFYLIASANLLFAVFQTRMSETFIKMLAYAYQGARNLSAWRPDLARDTIGNQPNWPLFNRCYATLGFLQYIATLPALVFGLVTGLWAVGELTHWNSSQAYLWWAIGLGVLGGGLDLVTARYKNTLVAMNRVALCNRLQAGANFAAVLTNCGVILSGGGLLIVVVVPICYSVLLRQILLRQLPCEVVRSSLGLDKEVVGWAWTPLWKGALGSLSNIGAQRSAGLFLAATGMPGLTAQYLLSRNLLQTIQSISCAPFSSQLPRYAGMLARDERKMMVEISLKRMGISIGLMTLGMIALGIVGPIALSLIGSKVPFLEPGQWYLFGVLFVAHQSLNLMGTIHNLTNQERFYVRSIIAAAIALSVFYLGYKTENIYWFIVGASAPYIFILNIYPITSLQQLSGLSVRNIISATLGGLRIKRLKN